MQRIGLVSVALLVTLLTLAFSAGIGLAADYQDAKHNVCEGTFAKTPLPAACEWGTHVTGFENAALGDAMMTSLTSGSFNAALDFGALESNTTGEDNVALGVDTLFSNTTGSDNIASGFRALQNNTTGSDNLATGTEALASNKTGENNLASGTEALNLNTTGSDNLASGFQALHANTTGERNLASGEGALFLNTTGSFNVAIGASAGHNLTTGSNNIDIANEGVAAEAGTTRIGTEKTQTRAFIAGVDKTPLTGKLLAVKVNESGQLGTAKASSGRLKQEVRGLGASAARVLSLHPVSFRYKPQFAQGSDQLEYGLIAEQVARLFPSLVQYEANGKPGGVYYEELPVLLLAQLQREHTRVSRQQQEIARLQREQARATRQQQQIDQLASELASLRAEMHAHR